MAYQGIKQSISNHVFILTLRQKELAPNKPLALCRSSSWFSDPQQTARHSL